MLWQILSRFDRQTNLIITKKGPLCIADIATHRNSFFNRPLQKNNNHPLIEKNVLIATSDASDALKDLCVLDGLVQSIGFASPSLPDEDIQSIARKGLFDCVIWDNNRPAGTHDGIIFCHVLSDTKLNCKQTNSISQALPHIDSQNMQTKWVMTTSGTTGEPKLVSHHLKGLTRTTKGVGESRRDVTWGMLYDYTRFAGMQVFLQSCLSGSTLVVPDPSDSLTAQIRFLHDHDVDCLSGTPTLWRKILMQPESKKLLLKSITLGGEIVDQPILNALSERFPESRVTHIYASTEAGVGFSVKDKQAGFPASYVDNERNNTSLKISDNGMLLVQNRAVTSNYIGEERLVSDNEGWIATGDIVEFKNGRYHFLGRESGLINVGGNKVLPEKIETVLLQHSNVLAARAYSKKNPITGALVAADIVVDTTKQDEREIKRLIKLFAAKKLEKFEVPAFIRCVETIELNSSGKIKRH